MAGTLFGLSLSQRVDVNGLPSIGWLLYLYQGNTSTPVDSFQDTGLSVLNAWPLVADSFGMQRQFWLPDGTYRARATNADGSITYFDMPAILAIGASTVSDGGGGGGTTPPPSVDVTAIFQTGDVMWMDVDAPRTGWVRDNGRTIGSSTSGGTERQNADCQPLFEFLWNTFADSLCPVVSGRGSSAGADWSANKQITLPDKRGRSARGLDDMGNTPAGRYGAVPFTTGDAVTPGSICGNNRTILTVGQLPSHTHTFSGNTGVESVPHTHSQIASTSTGSYSAGGSNGPLGNGSQTGTESVQHTHPISGTSDATGNADLINNVDSGILGTFYRKL